MVVCTLRFITTVLVGVVFRFDLSTSACPPEDPNDGTMSTYVAINETLYDRNYYRIDSGRHPLGFYSATWTYNQGVPSPCIKISAPNARDSRLEIKWGTADCEMKGPSCFWNHRSYQACSIVAAIADHHKGPVKFTEHYAFSGVVPSDTWTMFRECGSCFVETVPTARLCVKDQNSATQCFEGTYDSCRETPGDTVYVEFLCNSQCGEADVSFWYRLVLSPPQAVDWCLHRNNQFPGDLATLPSGATLPTYNALSPDDGTGAAPPPASSSLAAFSLLLTAAVLAMAADAL